VKLRRQIIESKIKLEFFTPFYSSGQYFLTIYDRESRFNCNISYLI
jgi:hypothetical protein